MALAGLAIYLRLSDVLRGSLRWLLFIFGFLIVLGVHYYVLHLQTIFWHTWKDFLFLNGANQFILFGARYQKLILRVEESTTGGRCSLAVSAVSSFVPV